MEQIKRMRERLNMSRKVVAEQLEVTEEYLYMIEKGTRSPSVKLAKKMSVLFGVTMDDIFFANQHNKTLCSGKGDSSGL